MKQSGQDKQRQAMRPGRAHQAGGTFLGLILGALLGLGAALAVAVYVTKVPIPFLNKGQVQTADDAAEARKNKSWDPNAPLAGKNAIKTAPVPVVSGPVGMTETAPISPPPLAGGVATAPLAVASAARPTGSTKPVPDDPLGDLAKARVAKAEARAAEAKVESKPDAVAAAALGSTADPFSYFIQVGAFRTPEDAEQQRAKLTLLGFQAKVTEREQAGRTVYRVRLGPFDKKDDADRTKERLDGNSIETALVRVQR